jgi:hypothetical protein
MENDKMTYYLQLLLAYRSLPARTRSRTVMEVAGYPHYENVASNILAFFLQPAEEHGLGDLLLTSLMAALPDKNWQTWEFQSDVTVEREHWTDMGGRLDLIIVARDLVIGIENKIYHTLNNDLSDYKNLIEKKGSKESTRIKIVLSPNIIRNHRGMEESGFISLSYPMLWKSVRARLGTRVHTAHNKWLHYLIDFMTTTTNIAGQTEEITPSDEFFIQNQEIISNLFRDRQDFLDRINQLAKTLKDLFDEEKVSPKHVVKRWLYTGDRNGDCIVHEFSSQGRNITLDLYVTPSGWKAHFFSKSEKSLLYIDQLRSHPTLSNLTMNLKLIGGRYIGIVCPLKKPVEDVKQYLQSWVESISEAIDSMQPAAELTTNKSDMVDLGLLPR